MPTFDFANILRKIVSVTISVAFSPLTIVVTAATVVPSLLSEWVSVFDLPDWFKVPSAVDISDNSHLVQFALYIINYDLIASIINWAIGFVSSLIEFIIEGLATFTVAGATLYAYKIIRVKIKDLVS